MSFSLVILAADSLSDAELSTMSKSYYQSAQLEYYYILRAARWLKLFKALNNTWLQAWKNTVFLFRKANYYYFCHRYF